MGIRWEHGNRTGFPHARPRANIPASFGLMLVGPFHSGVPSNTARKRGDAFQPRSHLPAWMDDMLLSAMIHALRRVYLACAARIRTDRDE